MEVFLNNHIEIQHYPNEPDAVAVSSEFREKMSKRRSIRHFSSQPVDREIILNAIKTAGSAPSGANRQPWYFALVTTQSVKEKIRRAAEQVEQEFYDHKATEEWLNDLKPFDTNSVKPYLSEAPALIAVFSRSLCENEDGSRQRSYYPVESTGIATGFLLTALHYAGLATLTHTPKPMFFLNEVLELDKTYRPFMIVVTGYPKRPIKVPKITRKLLHQIMDEY
ncbi:MAG: nitroreductase family protein [Bdellovibrionaceae bacterium]|nr:nitroreductase family protein [Pseudobdellovibrionaceae bacterium]